jgi:hypothetical protein
VITVEGQVPEAHVLVVVVVEGPANLNLVLLPSVGTIMVMVQEGRAAKLCWFPSKAIVPGFTEQPVIVALAVGTPLATDIVICSVTEASTVNVVDAVFPRASVAVRVCEPTDDEGTMKEALKVPVVDEVTVEGDVVWVTPSYVIVIVEEAAKPVPDTVIIAPTILLAGDRTIEAATVNVAEAEWAETSVAVTVCAPFVETGTANVALNDPIVEEATVVGEVVCVTPSYLIVIVDEAA